MHAAFAILILVGFIGGMYPETKAARNEVIIAPVTGSPLRTIHSISPLSEMMDKNILKQEFDYSCGSAALGTMLNYCLGEDFTEKEIIEGLFEYGDSEQVKRLRAFSLWDMQKFVEAIGYQSAGFTAEISDLKEPDQWASILLIELFGYRHFVVFKGIHKGHVVLADPSRGNITYPLKTFEKIWHKNILYKILTDKGCLPNLRMKETDMRFIDQDMQRTIMLDFENPFEHLEERKAGPQGSGLWYKS